MARIVFMGTPEFALPSLRSLMSHQQVVGVVTQPDRPAGRGRSLKKSAVKQLAQEADIDVFQPKTLRQEESIERLRKWEPETIVVAAFGQILPKKVLDLPPAGAVNVHGSLLPRWRGASPIQYAILAGDSESGISLMKMDPGLDTGPVYIQERVELSPRETASELHDKLAELGGRLLANHLEAIIEGKLKPQPQDEALATYAPQVKKKAGLIDWNKSSLEIDRQIRAMTPWPGAYTSWQGKNMKVIAARPFGGANLPGGVPGQIVQVQGSIIIQTGTGGLELLEVQLAGKRVAQIDNFLHGRPDFIGSQVGT
jgi:methionyl-tRNA formyltransferase